MEIVENLSPPSPCAERYSRSEYYGVIRIPQHRLIVLALGACRMITVGGLSAAGLPCSHVIICLHATGSNPGDSMPAKPLRQHRTAFPAIPCRSAVPSQLAYLGANPFTCVAACKLPVYASLHLFSSLQKDPPAAQHSVLNCWLGFVEAAFPGGLMACASRRTRYSQKLWMT
jgi:hypothetical protein